MVKVKFGKNIKKSKNIMTGVVVLIAKKKWRLNVIDIKTAFLQKEKIDKKIFATPPKEAETMLGY